MDVLSTLKGTIAWVVMSNSVRSNSICQCITVADRLIYAMEVSSKPAYLC